MRVIAVVVTVALSIWSLPALAQEDAGAEDVVAVEDAASVEDAGRSHEDAAQMADTGAEDAVAPGDGGAEDVARVDGTTADVALEDVWVVDGALDAGAIVDAAFDAGPGCEAVTFIGECDGDLVRYCNGEHLVERDCTTEFGAWATCGLLNCSDAEDPECLGYYCVARAGQACDELSCDVATGMGCLGGVCASSETCDPASYQPQCRDEAITDCDHVVNEHACSEADPPTSTCAVVDGRAVCAGLEGAACDPTRGPACAPGLRCEAGVCVWIPDAGGQIQVDAATDAGDGGEEEPGCGCAAAQAGAATWGLAALALLPVLGRRRRAHCD